MADAPILVQIAPSTAPQLAPQLAGAGAGMSPENFAQAVASLRKSGYAESEIAKLAGPDMKIPAAELKSHLRQGEGMPAPAAPGDRYFPGSEMPDYENALHAVGASHEAATVLDGALADAQEAWGKLEGTTAQEQYRHVQGEVFKNISRHVGGEKEALRLSDIALSHMPASFVQRLKDSGALVSALAIVNLAMIGQQIEARAKK